MGKKTAPFPNYPAWTTAKFFGFLRSGLRQLSSKYPPKYEILKQAKRPSRSSNKRLKYEYQCNQCKGWFAGKDVSVDHIIPCGQLSNFEDVQPFVERLFCGPDGLQVLCDTCHNIKTREDIENM